MMLFKLDETFWNLSLFKSARLKEWLLKEWSVVHSIRIQAIQSQIYSLVSFMFLNAFVIKTHAFESDGLH